MFFFFAWLVCLETSPYLPGKEWPFCHVFWEELQKLCLCRLLHSSRGCYTDPGDIFDHIYICKYTDNIQYLNIT